MPEADARHAKAGAASSPASASEETPLLRPRDNSNLSIPFADDGSQHHGARKPSSDDDGGVVEPTVTALQGVGVGINLWILIFLQGKCHLCPLGPGAVTGGIVF